MPTQLKLIILRKKLFKYNLCIYYMADHQNKHITKDFIKFTIPYMAKDKEGSKIFNIPSWKTNDEPKKLLSNDKYKSMCNPNHKINCVLTGERNNVTVFDFDTPEQYYNFINKYPEHNNSFTVQTPKGFHVYTAYNPNYKTTTNKNINIDIRNDHAFAFGEGSNPEYEGEYKYFCGDRLDIMVAQEFYNYVKPNNCNQPAKKKIKKNVTSNQIINNHIVTPTYNESILFKLCDIINLKYIENYDDWFKIVCGLKDYHEVAVYLSERSPLYKSVSRLSVEEKHKNDCSGFTVGWLYHYAKESNIYKFNEITNNIYFENLNSDGERSDFFYKFFKDLFLYDRKFDTMYFHSEQINENGEWILQKNNSHIKTFIRLKLLHFGNYRKDYITQELNELNNYKIEQEKKIEDKNLSQVEVNRCDSEIKLVCKKITDLQNTLKNIITQIKKNGSNTEINSICRTLTDSIKANTQLDICFDQNDEQLYNVNFRNGIYEMDTKTFRPREKTDLVTQWLDWDYDESRKIVTPEIEKDVNDFFKKVQPDELQRKLMIQWLAYCLTGDIGKTLFKTNVGESASNAKSTEISLFRLVFNIYYHKLSNNTFTLGNTKAHKDLIKLIRNPIRLAVIEELDTKLLDDSKLKDFVDGKDLTVEVMFGDTDSFKLQSKLMTTSQHKIVISKDEGTLRRGLQQEYNSKFKSEFTEDNYETHEYIKINNYEDRFKNDEYKNALFNLLIDEYDNDFKIPALNIEAYKDSVLANDPFTDIFDRYFIKTDNESDCIYCEDIREIFKDGKMTDYKVVKDRMKQMGCPYNRSIRSKKDDHNKGMKGCFTYISNDIVKE